MKNQFVIVIVSLPLLLLSYLPNSNAAQKIKVGVYNFSPLVFISETGKSSGFFPDILDYIAEQEGWEITYISGSWSECLTRLETGEIDLQVCIAYSAKRAEQFEFSDYLIMDWASVFKQKGSPIQTIFDLRDRTVSVIKSGITTDEFKRVLTQFNITCQILEKNENIENLKAVHDKKADAGICPNIYGTMVQDNYEIERTAIVFSPIKLGFATKKSGIKKVAPKEIVPKEIAPKEIAPKEIAPKEITTKEIASKEIASKEIVTNKEKNNELLSVINKHIAKLKADKNSVYYHLRDKWTGGYGQENILLPKWLLPLLLIIIFLFFLMVVFNIALKRQVKAKTSELVNINEQLSSSEERYRILFEQAAVGVAQIETETGRFFKINSKYCDIVGFTAEDMINMTFQANTYPEDLRANTNNMQLLIEGKIHEFSMETRYYHKSGSIVWVNLTVSPMWKVGEMPSFHIAVVEDITERKLAEAALIQSEEKFRVIFEQSPIGIVLSNTQGVILDCNNHFACIFGVEREKYYGINLLDRIPEGPVRQNLANACSNYELHQYEGTYTSVVSGKQLYMSMSSQKITADLVLNIIMDMTIHREAEEENHRLQHQLLQSQKIESIGRLAGGVAHDFNNMLGVIIGHAEILLDNLDTTEPEYQGLSAIQKAANRSADLTKQLLAFARKQTVNPQVVDLNEAVEGMLSMLERIMGENVQIFRIKDRILEKIKIDPAQIDQIVVNLCINARDAILEKYNNCIKSKNENAVASENAVANENAIANKNAIAIKHPTGDNEKGKITIETSSMSFDHAYCNDHIEAPLPGYYIMLAVSDNGCGMDKKTLSQIFDPFFTTKEMNKGTGLGLASVYGIVKQNNGFINVYSEPGEGTTFRVYLPRYDNNYDNNENIENESSYKIEECELTGKETILLVEDEISLLELGETMLKRLGYTVLTASSPKEAIDINLNYTETIDLLITDVIMPEINGRELARQLFEVRPNMQCLFMSGYTANVIAHHGVLEHGVYFIQKPFSIQELSVKIRSVLQNSENFQNVNI